MTRAVAFCMLVSLAGGAQTIDIPRPADREFVMDRTQMVTAADRERIAGVCERLLTERAIPMVVLTVPSLAAHASQRMGIEVFARGLFDQWGAGGQLVHGVAWTRGILLLVSREDRKARIELGVDWDRSFDHACRAIMDENILPSFRRGDYSGGIAEGIVELDKMARGQRPLSSGWGTMRSYNPTASPWFFVGVILLAGILRIWRFISYYGVGGYGRGGYYGDTHYRHRPYGGVGGSSGGPLSGGSSRGGSSGGGATGSW